MFRMDKSKQLHLAVHLVHDLVTNIGTIETGNENPRAIEAKALNDFFPRHAIRRRRQCDARYMGKSLMQNRKLDVFGAEVMPPLRHAVRLINGEQRKRRARQKIEKAR